jgi:hypothetical protein
MNFPRTRYLLLAPFIAVACNSSNSERDDLLIQSLFRNEFNQKQLDDIRRRMPEIEERLIVTYDSREPGREVLAIGEILSELGTRKTGEYIDGNLKSKDEQKVALALNLLRNKANVSAVTFEKVRTLLSFRSDRVQLGAVTVLVRDSNHGSRKAVLNVLKQAVPDDRPRLLSAFNSRDAKWYFGHIVSYLRDPNEEVRIAAAYALFAIDRPRAVEVVRRHRERSERVKRELDLLLGR